MSMVNILTYTFTLTNQIPQWRKLKSNLGLHQHILWQNARICEAMHENKCLPLILHLGKHICLPLNSPIFLSFALQIFLRLFIWVFVEIFICIVYSLIKFYHSLKHDKLYLIFLVNFFMSIKLRVKRCYWTKKMGAKWILLKDARGSEPAQSERIEVKDSGRP